MIILKLIFNCYFKCVVCFSMLIKICFEWWPSLALFHFQQGVSLHRLTLSDLTLSSPHLFMPMAPNPCVSSWAWLSFRVYLLLYQQLLALAHPYP